MINCPNLKEVLNYNPETGIFTWLIDRNDKVKKGMVAGTFDKKNYVIINTKSKNYKAHRLAWLYMTGEFPENEIDHINHITDDNRWCNLRHTTHSENQKNRRLSKNNTSGFNGVFWSTREKRWYSHIKIKGKIILLGIFKEKDDAIKVRKEANIKYGFHTNHGK